MAATPQDHSRLTDDLLGAERALEYLQGLRPYTEGDAVENSEAMRSREMAIEDVRERIKEIREEIDDQRKQGGSGKADQ